MDINDINPQDALKFITEEAEEKVKTATALSIMRSTDGWKILLDTFEEMKNNQLRELSKQRPGDEKNILAAHAVWAATVHTLDQVVEAVDSAIHEGILAQDQLEGMKRGPQEEDWP